MSNMYGKDKFHDRQKAVLQKSAQKIENDSGWSQDNFLRGYAEEILPASGAELSFGELCAIGEQVEQEAAFSAKEAMRNKIKARRDAERYKSTGTDSEQRTPNPFEDSSAIATESPKNEDTLNTMRKHADAQPTKSAGIKTSKKQSLVETTRELKKYIYVKGDFEPLVSEEMWERCQQILASRSARVIDENGKKHKYMRNTPKSVWTAKLRCSCGAGFIQFKWRVNRDGAVIHGFQCYRRTRRPSISYLQEHGLDLSISCQIKAISEWKLDLMAAKVFEHLTFDKGKTVKEVYKILSRCMAEEKTVRISRKAMLEKSIAKQRERLDKYIDLCADGIITKQELMERRKGLDNQIADLQSQYESVEQEDERSGALDMNLISQKLDEWQRASKNDVDRELINSCVAQITPLTNEEFRWALDFQMSEVRARNAAAYTMDGFVEMARFSISFEEAKAFKASRNQGIRKNEWQDLTVVVGIWSKTQK